MKTITNICAMLWGLTDTFTKSVSSYPPSYAGGKFYDSHFTNEEISSSIPDNCVTPSESLALSGHQLS